MAFRGIYFNIIAAEPIKEVVYCCFKVSTSKNVFPQLCEVVSSAYLEKTDL